MGGREGRIGLLGGDPLRRRDRRQPPLGRPHLVQGDPAGGDGRRGDRGPSNHDGAGPAGPHPAATPGEPWLHPPDRGVLRGPDPRPDRRDPGRRPGPGRVRLRRRGGQGAAHADAGSPSGSTRRARRAARGLGRPAAVELGPGVHRPRGGPGGHRRVQAHPVPQPGRPGGLPVRPGGRRRTPGLPERRRHLASPGANHRRRAAERPGVQQLLRPAGGGRQRHHPVLADRGTPGARGPPRPDAGPARRPVAHRNGRGGDPALDLGDHTLPANRHQRPGPGRLQDRRGRQGGALVDVCRLRRPEVRRPLPVRHRS